MEFDLNIKELNRLKRSLNPKLVKKAEPIAINKAAQIARTAQSKEIRTIYNITAKRLNEELEKVTGPNRATANQPRAVIRAKKLRKRNPGLQNYSATQTKKGVSYRIRKDQGRKKLPHAFKATMPKGGEGVFVRTGKKRLPIVRKVGPSVVQMMERIGIKPVRQSVNKNFARLFRNAYKRELEKSKR